MTVRSRGPSQSSREPVPERQISILVVEDDADLRALFRDVLKSAGFESGEAGDGKAALQLIDQKMPDLVVLDLVLPTLDGVALIGELGGRTRTARIPVVVVTGWNRDDLDDLKVRCVLRKPVSSERLIAAVRECLAVAGAARSRQTDDP